MIKTCFKCGESKPLSAYYPHKRMKDGHLNKCKECTKADVTLRRRTNPYVQEYDRRRYQNPERKAKQNQRNKQWVKDNPEKYKAHYMISNAIRDNRIKRKPCEVCGNPYSHAHHDDYSKPLEVRFLCPSHHFRHHHGEPF